MDAGYDAPRIAHLLAGLPVEILGRLRSDRVMRRPTPPRVYNPKGGRPPKHGGEFLFGQPETWGAEQAVTITDTRLYGKATAQAWDRLHPRLTHRAAWTDYEGPLPIIEGSVIRLTVENLPSGGVSKPVWLWWSGTGAAAADVDRCWQSFLRRFDVEHTFRMLKQTLGWTKPRLRSPEAADRWTWLVIAPPGPARDARQVRRTVTQRHATTLDASWPRARLTHAPHITRRAPNHDARGEQHNEAKDLGVISRRSRALGRHPHATSGGSSAAVSHPPARHGRQCCPSGDTRRAGHRGSRRSQR